MKSLPSTLMMKLLQRLSLDKLYLYTEKINRQSLKRTDSGLQVTYLVRDLTNYHIMKIGGTHNIFRIIILFMGLNKTPSLMSR